MYQLTEKTIQKPDTYQCWWLSFLEILRASERINPLYEEGGILHLEVPHEDGDLIYGTNWQKVVMHYLRNHNWNYGPRDTVNTSDRKSRLIDLLGILGIQGVTIQNGISLDFDVPNKLNGFQVGTRLQVDKPNHAMSGVVQIQNGKRGILVFNQMQNSELFYRIKDNKLKSPSGNTTLNYCFKVTFD